MFYSSISNKLSAEDVVGLWLPYIIYKNTDNSETTRLATEGEWRTDVMVNRTHNTNTSNKYLKEWKEGNETWNGEDDFIRSGLEVLDEAEIFHGATNTLIMSQTYTRSFQCKYQLQNYPFDTQVT